MFTRAFMVSTLVVVGCVSTACANSCSNVNAFNLYDESGLREGESRVSAAGTFRIAGEEDENKQPMFNLAKVNCENQVDDTGKASLACKVISARVWASPGKPDTDSPNCSLDLNSEEFSMKELQKGILIGTHAPASTGCWETILTIDRNTKRVYLSFTRTKSADDYDRTKPGACGAPPPTQVLMNCTAWPRIRALPRAPQGRLPPRYCDFSGSRDK